MRIVRLAGFVLVLGLAICAQASAATPRPYPAPSDCDHPVSLADATGGDFCISAALVTRTDNTNGETFTVTDGRTTRTGQIAPGHPSTYNSYGWSLGPMTAGQVVSLWGTVDPSDPNHTLYVQRWVERTHGMPSTSRIRNRRHPYPLYTALDISRGRYPEHRMAWSLVVPFAELPQTREIGGDGDVHVQTMSPCPAAGLTTETVPQLLGHVDAPYDFQVPDPTDDAAKQELGQVPPIGVPVVILGGLRYDTDYGWWELHPIRAWHFPTAAEVRWAQQQCAHDPVVHLDHQLPIPTPYGFPACGHSPLFGSELEPITDAAGFQPCRPICYVAATSLGQPEQLAPPGVCQASHVRPIVTRSQLPANRSLDPPSPGKAAGPGSAEAAPATAGAEAAAEGDAGPEIEHLPPEFSSPAYLQAVERSYCRGPLPSAGTRGDPFSGCR